MDCRQVTEALVAYSKGELGNDETAAVRQHLTVCPSCAEASESLSQAFKAFRSATALTPLPEGARARLLERIRADEVDCASSRQGARSKAEQGGRALLRAKFGKGPYFAASILLHAAAAVCLVAVPLLLSDYLQEDSGVSESGPRVEFSPAVKLYSQRTHAPGHERTLTEGRIEVNTIRPAQVYLVAAAEGDRYLAAYPAGGLGNPTEATLLRQFGGASVAARLKRLPVKDGEITVPRGWLSSVFGDERQVVLVDLLGVRNERRLEIWSMSKWKTYAQEQAQVGHLLDKRCGDRLVAAVVILTVRRHG